MGKRPDFGAHISGMTNGTQITVHFTCPKFGLGYKATQEHVPGNNAGSL